MIKNIEDIYTYIHTHTQTRHKYSVQGKNAEFQITIQMEANYEKQIVRVTRAQAGNATA